MVSVKLCGPRKFCLEHLGDKHFPTVKRSEDEMPKCWKEWFLESRLRKKRASDTRDNGTPGSRQ